MDKKRGLKIVLLSILLATVIILISSFSLSEQSEPKELVVLEIDDYKTSINIYLDGHFSYKDLTFSGTASDGQVIYLLNPRKEGYKIYAEMPIRANISSIEFILNHGGRYYTVDWIDKIIDRRNKEQEKPKIQKDNIVAEVQQGPEQVIDTQEKYDPEIKIDSEDNERQESQDTDDDTEPKSTFKITIVEKDLEKLIEVTPDLSRKLLNRTQEIVLFSEDNFYYRTELTKQDNILKSSIPKELNISNITLILYYEDSIMTYDNMSSVLYRDERKYSDPDKIRPKEQITSDFKIHSENITEGTFILKHQVSLEYDGLAKSIPAYFKLPLEKKESFIKRQTNPEDQNKIDSIRLRNLTSAVKQIDFRSIEYKGAINLGIEDVEIEDYIQSYAIDPAMLNFTNATVTATAKGTELYKCKEWNFTAQKCFGSWVKIMDIKPGQNYTFLLTPDDPAFGEMRIQKCVAQELASASGSWNVACDNAYPGETLYYEDAAREIHKISKSGTTWAGVRINSTNSSVTDCDSIDSVTICYKWWAATTRTQNCDISIDSDYGNSYTAVSAACPGTAEPAVMTCVNVTASENWQCGNFFGETPTGAIAKSEIQHSGSAGPGNYDVIWDVLYFNVSYSPPPDYPPYWSGNSSFTPIYYSETTDSTFNITWEDYYGLNTSLFESNFSGTKQNYTMTNQSANIFNYTSILPAGSFYWTSHANDSIGQWNLSDKWYFTILRADPGLTISADPTDTATYGTQTNITCSLNTTQITPALYRNSTLISGTSDIQTLGAGSYNYTCNISQTQNFTYNSSWTLLNVTKAAGVVALYLNGSRNNRTIQLGTSLNISADFISGSGILQVYNNNTLIFNSTLPSENMTFFNTEGFYNITALYNGNQNYTSDSETWWVNATTQEIPDYPPKWSANKTDIVSIFKPSMNSSFNITWTDDVKVEDVLFESNFSKVPTNYTMNEITLNVYNFQQVFPAGSFYWKSYANDSAGNINMTDVWYFTIARADPNLTLSAQPGWNTTYSNQTNISCKGADSQITPLLYRNASPVANPDVQTLDVAEYLYICNSTQTQNYTSSEIQATLNISRADSSIELTLNGYRSNITAENNTFVTIQATLLKGDGNITIYQNGSLLYNGTSPYQENILFNNTSMNNITAYFHGTENYNPGNETWWIDIVPELPLSLQMTINNCSAEDAATAAGTWGDACDRKYPGPALFYDDIIVENHPVEKSGYWAGIRTNTSNNTIENCILVESVQFCYKWWSDTSDIMTCDISVDADQGANYTAVTNTCPGTTEPSGITCVDITSDEDWTCGVFFGSNATSAIAKSELVHSGSGGPGQYEIYWDAFYFNVTYYEDRTPPASVTNLDETKTSKTWIIWNWTNPSDSDFYRTEIWINGSFYSNLSQNYTNISDLAPNTIYEIGTRTSDIYNNLNELWINDTAQTQEDQPPAAFLVNPENNSRIASSSVGLQARVEDNDTELLCLDIFSSDAAESSDDLLFRLCDISNNTLISYTWDAPVLNMTAETEALWHFDNRSEHGENSTLVKNFASSAENHDRTCTTNCPTFIENGGKFAGAFDYDGVSQYWLLNESFFNSPFDNKTVQIWIKPDALAGIQTIYEEGGRSDGFALRLNSTILEFATSGGGTKTLITTNYTDTSGWHLITAIFDGGNMSIFLDGLLKNTTTASYSSISSHADEGGIGATVNQDSLGSAGPNYFNGRIDETRILNSSRTTDSIRDDADLSDNTYHWFTRTSDDLSDVNSSLWQFTLDSSIPLIKDVWPEEDEFIIFSIIEITANVTDNTGIDNVYANITWNKNTLIVNMTDNDLDDVYNATFDFANSSGSYNITVYANDTSGNKNTYSTWFRIQKESYNYYYGNATGRLALGYILTTLKNMTEGQILNVYAADADSVFSVNDLQAIGRKKDGTTASQDFLDMDIVLNISNRSDSINATWSIDSTIPKEMQNITLYGLPIYNVSMINSTENSSSFKTGILWDTSDSLDDEFDIAEEEDLIFYTSYNSGQTGSYGTYGFEIRIPEKLNSYKGFTEEIVFYVEIR